ncbi:hypothetical protein F66182_3388 [Fusarium sp. NRRL 66182]|nr:hypothetical protein F66182_3388 [Fusarium sp. NRRL 66182]
MRTTFILTLASCAAVLASEHRAALAPSSSSSDHGYQYPEEWFDYIIVGAGIAGTTLANRLTASGEFQVLLLEAGQLDQHEDFVTIPGLSATAAGTKYDWNLTSSPSPATGNRAIPLPMGKVVGGGSTINRMIFVRGSAADFDRWEEFTERGWGWNDMFKNFIKAENAVAAARELGVRILRDGMGGDNAGGFFATHSQKPVENVRSSGRTAHYDAAADRSNLRLIQNAHVTKVQVEYHRAVGVKFIHGQNSTHQVVKARKEVILSAGSIFSPQILQLSGIGDATDLAALNITSIVHLPGVGRNLQDHPVLVTVNAITSHLSSANLTDPTFASDMMALYKSNRTGPYANPTSEFVMFLPTSNFSSNATALYQAAREQNPGHFLPEDTPPSVLEGYAKQHALLTAGLASDAETPLEVFWSDGTLAFGVQHPFSRGSVKLVSKDPLEPPAVDPGFLTNPIDMAIMVDAVKFARAFAATAAVASLSPVEIVPGANITADADIESFIRENIGSFAHYASTCRVGPRRTGGVVSDDFRVHGVQNLRVVDASVIPLLPAAHTSTTVYALAEKAADIILCNNSAGV